MTVIDDRFAIFVGKFVFYVGGVLFALVILATLVWLASEAWIIANDRWRRIFKAEKSIFEYKKYRDIFFEWYMERNKNHGND